MHPRIKICCISSLAEARLAITEGADALGLVGPMPSGPGVIDDATIAEIAAAVPPAIATFLLTAQRHGDAIADHAARCGTSTVQIVDTPEPGAYARIRRALPKLTIVQVLHVRDHQVLDEARAAAPEVDMLLLDSGNPTLAIKELGGTGRVHDWSLSARLVAAVDKPVFLAGGLSAVNVAGAIAQVRPFGLDICSGVRSDGRLDAPRLRAFIKAARPTS